MWYPDKIPAIHKVRTWGSTAWTFDHKKNGKFGKLNAKSTPGILIGQELDAQVHIVYDPKAGKIYRRRDCVLDERLDDVSPRRIELMKKGVTVNVMADMKHDEVQNNLERTIRDMNIKNESEIQQKLKLNDKDWTAQKRWVKLKIIADPKFKD